MSRRSVHDGAAQVRATTTNRRRTAWPGGVVLLAIPAGAVDEFLAEHANPING
jgi:hypothetical protein